jgi:hypothetical protein
MLINPAMSLSGLAEAMGSYVEPATAAAMRNILCEEFLHWQLGDIHEEDFWAFAVQAAENPQAYPDGLHEKSARVAYDVPRSSAGSVIAELRRILDLCVDWGTAEAENLRDECREYLDDMGA